jgi:hypothetical protein
VFSRTKGQLKLCVRLLTKINLQESRKLEAQASKLTSQSVKWVKLLEEFQEGLKVVILSPLLTCAGTGECGELGPSN